MVSSLLWVHPIQSELTKCSCRSIILFVVCIMSFVWRTGTTQDNTISAPTFGDALGPRIAITVVFSLGMLYFILIITTLRRYGDVMDKAWRERVIAWTYERPSSAHYSQFPRHDVQHHAAPSTYPRTTVNDGQAYFGGSHRSWNHHPVGTMSASTFPVDTVYPQSAYSNHPFTRNEPYIIPVIPSFRRVPLQPPIVPPLQSSPPTTESPPSGAIEPPPSFARPAPELPEFRPPLKTTKIVDLRFQEHAHSVMEVPIELQQWDIQQADWQQFVTVSSSLMLTFQITDRS